MRRLTTVLCLVLAAPAAAQPAAQAAPVLDPITTDLLSAHTRLLSSDLLEGRAPGTRGGRLTEQYVASQFERIGLEPAGADGSWFQPVTLAGLTPEPSMVIGANRRTVALEFGDDFVAWPERPEATVTADGEVVFVGYGIVAPERGWDDYAGTPLTGKVALILVNDPGIADSTLFEGRTLTYYGRWTYKLEQAARMGAAGAILIHTEESATYPWRVVRSSWTGEQLTLVDAPPTSLRFAAWITWEAAQRVLDQTGRDLQAMVRRAGQPGFRPIATGAWAAVDIRSRERRFTASNVVARLPGRDTLRGEEAVLVTAHHDHIGIGSAVDGDSIYNGAADNASGVAAMLAAAEALARSPTRPRRSVIFLATTAEEAGLLGAEAYIRNPAVPLHRTAALFNIDLANLRGATTDIGGLGQERSTLGAVFEAAATAESLAVADDPEPWRGSFYRSDHFPFARAGIPVISIRIGTRFVDRPPEWGAEAARRYNAERYHQPADEIGPDTDFTGAVQQARTLARAVWRVAGETAWYGWNDGSEFREAGRRLEALRRSQ